MASLCAPAVMPPGAILKEIGRLTAKHSPAYTTVLVAGLLLPGTVVEIEAVVVLGNKEA